MADHNTTNNEQKKEELKRVTLEAITKECRDKSSSEHADLRAIAEGLAKGRELDLTILTGGLCNYSYKIHFADQTDDDAALFAKMTFGSPLFFPDVPCPLNRTNCEHEMMDLYSKVSPFPESTVTPYFCIDVDCEEDNTKILATQFAPSNLEEQAGHLFIDGGVLGTAFASKLAKGLAALHNAKVTDPDFNKDIKPFFMALSGLMPSIFDGYLGIGGEDENDAAAPEPPSSPAAEYARLQGKEKLDRIVEVYAECLQRSDCYVHGDAHAFNILVEGKNAKSPNDVTVTESVTSDTSSCSGDFCLIDWEMTHVGPMGKDLGWVFAFPVACLCAHAVQGDTLSSESILESLDVLWSEYSAAIDLDGKDDLTLVDVYRQVLGFSGMLMQGYSEIGFHMDYLPIEEGPDAEALAAAVKGSLGLIAIKALSWGFGEDGETATLEDLKGRFHGAVRDELRRLAPTATVTTQTNGNGVRESESESESKSKSRRSSLLRTSGRRVSDSHVFLEISNEFRRASVSSASASALADTDDALASAAAASRRRASLAVTRSSIQELEQVLANMNYN